MKNLNGYDLAVDGEIGWIGYNIGDKVSLEVAGVPEGISGVLESVLEGGIVVSGNKIKQQDILCYS